jgi:ParB family chromosome partitioning protein
MAKDYRRDVDERFIFLSPVQAEGSTNGTIERNTTIPLRAARLIPIDRIVPDPHQPRKRFVRESLESLAESIREAGGIIDPLTVEYEEGEKRFRVISGERRYRAASMMGMRQLPCIIREVDENQRLLVQLVANLQREDITPLEESAGLRSLIDRYGYSQARTAQLLNKSESYVSQMLGLERLSQAAKEFLQTSEVAKEVQIQASKEKDPEKQLEIVRKGAQGRTVRQMRSEGKIATSSRGEETRNEPGSARTPDGMRPEGKRFHTWWWGPEDKRFILTIQFRDKELQSNQNHAVKTVLEEALQYVRAVIHRGDSDGIQA